MTSLPRHWRAAVALFGGAALLAACTAEEAATGGKKKKTPVDPDIGFYDDDEAPLEPEPIKPDYINEDGGSFGAGDRPASPKPDAGPADGGSTGLKVYCTGDLAAGDLAIVEIMIASRSGANDDGEWVEIQNTRDCWLKAGDVVVESPRGAATPNAATTPSALELAPKGTFIVADTTDSAKNHGLRGTIVAWNATDVLKNDGDTILVKLNGTVVDQLTYPSFSNLVGGRSISFPSDCAPNHRTDWARWSLTFTEFSAGFKGTPNASNDDVACF